MHTRKTREMYFEFYNGRINNFYFLCAFFLYSQISHQYVFLI